MGFLNIKTPYIYESHSIDKVKYCVRNWQYETVASFSRKSIVMGLFIFLKKLNMIFYDHCAWIVVTEHTHEHIIIQATVSFRIRTGLYLFVSALGETRRDTQFIKAYVNHTKRDPPPHTPHLAVSKISTYLCRSRTKTIWSDHIRKNPTAIFNGRNPTELSFSKILKFSGPSLPGMTSTTHSIHSNCPSGPFLVWEFFLWKIMIILPFPCGGACTLSYDNTSTRGNKALPNLIRYN